MNKFFIAHITSVETSIEGECVYGPQYITVGALSFCNKENAMAVAEKASEIIRYDDRIEDVWGQIYAVDVPSGWTGGEIAEWLEKEIDKGTVEPLMP